MSEDKTIGTDETDSPPDTEPDEEATAEVHLDAVWAHSLVEVVQPPETLA